MKELEWKRSSYCDGGTCVEVATVGDHTLIRDSKDPDGPMLRFTAAEWDAFVSGVKGNEFD